MLTDAITVQLRLPGLVVLDAAEWQDRIEVATQYANEEASCPRCQRLTWQVHQWCRQQEVRGGRRLPGNLAWLMHRNVERLREADGERLAEALRENPALRQAWLLKEGLHSVYRKRTKDQAEAALESWIGDAQGSGLKPFQRTASTLKKWREEVLNYWGYPLTNAMVEGKHNRVKVLKRRAYSYRNDRTFSLRFLNCFHADCCRTDRGYRHHLMANV